MKISKLEQETIIGFNEAEATASVYTHNAALIRKLEALADSRPDEAKRERSYPDGGREYIVPKRWVKVNASRILTDEQRATMVEHGKSLQRAKLVQNSK